MTEYPCDCPQTLLMVTSAQTDQTVCPPAWQKLMREWKRSRGEDLEGNLFKITPRGSCKPDPWKHIPKSPEGMLR